MSVVLLLLKLDLARLSFKINMLKSTHDVRREHIPQQEHEHIKWCHSPELVVKYDTCKQEKT